MTSEQASNRTPNLYGTIQSQGINQFDFNKIKITTNFSPLTTISI